MIERKIDDINEDDIMNHTLNMIILINKIKENQIIKKAKDYKTHILHSVPIRVLIAKGWVRCQTTDDVYEIYEYIINNSKKDSKCLSKIQLTKTLTRYYGFKLVSKRMGKSIKRVFEVNESKDYFTLLEFFKDISEDEIINKNTNEVYNEYFKYCIRIGLLPINKGEFSKQVKKYFNFVIIDKKIQGKKCRIFVKAEDSRLVQDGSR